METLYWLVIDVAGSLALLGCGVLGVWTWRRAGARFDGSLYWVLAGAGLIYLAVDERLSLHERLGRRLDRAGFDAPGTNHADDAVLLAFALAGLCVSLAFVRELMRHRAVLAPLLVGGMVTALALAIDALAPVEGWAPVIEEHLELAGCALFLLAFVRRYRVAARTAGQGSGRAVAAAPAPISTL
ncbi:MAG: hypothetical protein ACR2HN_11985 [Tepidiformaceae bacterium]